MKNASISPEFELLVRERLTGIADHAPTAVRSVVDASDLALRPLDQATPKRRIAGIGALVIALGGGFALTTIAATGGDDGGASTPEAAVEEFIGALEQRDVLGALDLLDPRESEVLVDVVRRSADEAIRVGLLSDDADLSDVAGTTFDVEGLVMTTETVATDLAVVHLDEGLVDLRFDMTALPFAEGLRALATESTTGETMNLADGNLQIATVQRNGRWFVSVSFSIAEAARRAAGVEYPAEPAAVPEGFGSPEAAATAFWERLAGFDIRGAVAMAAPGEGDALARYAPLWLASADRALADARASGTNVTIGGLTFDVTGEGDHRQATPTSYVIEGTLPPVAQYTEYPVFDPAAPTLVYSYISSGGSRFLLIPAGDPIPDSFDIDQFVDEYPVELDEFQGPLNTAALNPNGTLEQYWVDDPTALEEPPSEPQQFRYELADGCTTMTGSAFDGSGFAGSLVYPGSGMEQLSDNVWRSCGESTSIQSVSALSVLLLRPGFGAAPQLPIIDVVEVDGQWYVSPLGTIFAGVLETFAAIDDGEVFSIDSAIASLLYGTDRVSLERSLIGLGQGSIPQSCELIAAVDDTGTVTGLVDDVPTTGLRECFYDVLSSTVSYTSDESVSVEYGPAESVVEVGVENTIAD